MARTSSTPPRYLKLLEIIPTAETDPEIVELVRNIGDRVLGKGCVIAKDTPNFIGNRLGSFTGMQSVSYALDNGYSIEDPREQDRRPLLQAKQARR